MRPQSLLQSRSYCPCMVSHTSFCFLPVIERERAATGQQRGKLPDLPHHPVSARIVPTVNVLRHFHAVGAKFRVRGLPIFLSAAFRVSEVVNVSNHHQRRIRRTDPFAGGARHPRRADSITIALNRCHVFQQLRTTQACRAGQLLLLHDFVNCVHDLHFLFRRCRRRGFFVQFANRIRRHVRWVRDQRNRGESFNRSRRFYRVSDLIVFSPERQYPRLHRCAFRAALRGADDRQRQVLRVDVLLLVGLVVAPERRDSGGLALVERKRWRISQLRQTVRSGYDPLPRRLPVEQVAVEFFVDFNVSDRDGVLSCLRIKLEMDFVDVKPTVFPIVFHGIFPP
nr:MAG TPA: hypothetical protein [Caudoviricetes sp.]